MNGTQLSLRVCRALVPRPPHSAGAQQGVGLVVKAGHAVVAQRVAQRLGEHARLKGVQQGRGLQERGLGGAVGLAPLPRKQLPGKWLQG